jgi:hypothetical protein
LVAGSVGRWGEGGDEGKLLCVGEVFAH